MSNNCFKYLIAVKPLGFMYGSAGAFLSPENLVGRSGTKFPPDAATMAGLFFHANQEHQFTNHRDLSNNLVVAGAFWAERNEPKRFYVPIPWHKVIAEKEEDEWYFVKKKTAPSAASDTDETNWILGQYRWHRDNKDLNPDYTWQLINSWNLPAAELRKPKDVEIAPWDFIPFLHPQLKQQERHVVNQDGLFLENAVQLNQNYCLVYLANYELPSGWYRFGGEGHLVDIQTHPLSETHPINKLLRQKIHHAFALITPGVWGSNKLSYRYPHHPSFPHQGLKMLTDRPIPYRYRIGETQPEDAEKQDYDSSKTGRLSRGRYAVPPGSVYVLKHPLNLTWWDFPDAWFPKEGFPLKHLGCGLCLPIDIKGLPPCTTKATA